MLTIFAVLLSIFSAATSAGPSRAAAAAARGGHSDSERRELLRQRAAAAATAAEAAGRLAVRISVRVDRTSHLITSASGSERAITSACREWCDSPVGRSVQLGARECATLIAERFRLERDSRRLPAEGDLAARPWLPADDARTVLVDLEGGSPAGATLDTLGP